MSSLMRRSLASAGWVEDLQILEVAAVDASIASKETISRLRGVSTDEEVGEQPISPARATAVCPPRSARRKRHRRVDGDESHTEAVEGVFGCA